MDTNRYNEMFYSDIFGKDPDKYYRIQRRKIAEISALFNSHPGGRILDIGCGDGFITQIIGKKTSAKMFGIDISSSAAEMSRKRGVECKVVNIDREKIPYPEGHFDAVFCGDIIEHVYDTEGLLENVKSVLKKGGYIIATVPNIASWYNRGFLLIGMMPTWIESSSKTFTGNPLIKNGVGHIHAFTKRSLVELLRLKGFRIEKVKGCPLMADGTRSGTKESIWNNVDSFFAKKATLASTIIVKAKK
jgi:2-polyprenyl-3-methyl-5-hydroxy-6-metoxy-1,4-benzoquinol methylase